MWVIPIYILNVAFIMYLLADHWDIQSALTICVIVDGAHYIITFLLLIGIWIKWPHSNSSRPLSWIEIFPTFGYTGCIFVLATGDINVGTIVGLVAFSVAILRYPIIVYSAMQKPRFKAIQEYYTD